MKPSGEQRRSSAGADKTATKALSVNGQSELNVGKDAKKRTWLRDRNNQHPHTQLEPHYANFVSHARQDHGHIPELKRCWLLSVFLRRHL